MIRLVLLITVLISNIYAQEQINTELTSDSTKVDSLTNPNPVKNSVLRNIFNGKPGKALSYSIVPGLGQIYNKRWWKLPIVYGTFAVPVYFIFDNTKKYRDYDKAFRMRVDTIPGDKYEGIYNLFQLNELRQFTDKNLQRSYLGLVGVFLLCGIDAFVDRHLMEFDVSEKLSLNITPSQDIQYGIRLGLCFR